MRAILTAIVLAACLVSTAQTFRVEYGNAGLVKIDIDGKRIVLVLYARDPRPEGQIDSAQDMSGYKPHTYSAPLTKERRDWVEAWAVRDSVFGLRKRYPSRGRTYATAFVTRLEVDFGRSFPFGTSRARRRMQIVPPASCSSGCRPRPSPNPPPVPIAPAQASRLKSPRYKPPPNHALGASTPQHPTPIAATPPGYSRPTAAGKACR